MTEDATGDAVTDRHGLEVLSTEACHELLASRPIGRVAFVEAGEAVVLPVTYRYHRHHVVFLTGEGAKLDAAIMGQAISFETDSWDDDAHQGWSVLVKGFAEEVSDPEAVAELESLGLEPWVGGRSRWIRLVATELTGRRIV